MLANTPRWEMKHRLRAHTYTDAIVNLAAKWSWTGLDTHALPRPGCGWRRKQKQAASTRVWRRSRVMSRVTRRTGSAGRRRQQGGIRQSGLGGRVSHPSSLDPSPDASPAHYPPRHIAPVDAPSRPRAPRPLCVPQALPTGRLITQSGQGQPAHDALGRGSSPRLHLHPGGPAHPPAVTTQDGAPQSPCIY